MVMNFNFSKFNALRKIFCDVDSETAEMALTKQASNCFVIIIHTLNKRGKMTELI